jgi:hypothetical protein
MAMIPDALTVAAGLKTTFDALRAAIGLIKDTKDLLPNDAKSDAITAALETAEASSKIAEAEIAKELGYQLCKCQFPPTPMLTVGYHTRSEGARPGSPVFECPQCGITSAGPFMYKRTAPQLETPPA